MKTAAKRRMQDIAYEAAMQCQKSHDDKHHFIPKNTTQRNSQELKCSHCGANYDALRHTPPFGYHPQ